MPIRRLPPLLVNQIAAGEVIERPASVVKEVVENAIDAGATRVSIAVEQGGCELIRVSDNGCGMGVHELPLAVAPHATSKLESADDLNAIATLGFRGEALASIASVSRLSILSRTKDSAEASIIEAEGEVVRPPRPASGPPGTTVTVRNLFFNTPARRKFLRSEPTEAGRVADVVENLALAHPAIAFEMIVDGSRRLELPVDQSPRERVAAIVGDQIAKELLEVDARDRALTAWGMIGTPSLAKGNARHIRFFLNGRTIADRSLTHAIKEAYRGLIDPARYPTVLLFLAIDPAHVDVNVHPAKAEVRFRNQSAVHGAVLSAVRQALRRADLTPALDIESSSWLRESASLAAASQAQSSPQQFVEYFRRLDPVQKGFVYSEVKQAIAAEAPHVLREELQTHAAVDEGPGSLPTVRPVSEVLQVHSSYIVTQDEQGLVIIDQHALHERVMFQKLKSRIDSGNLESQRLLMPAVIQTDRTHLAAMSELGSLLERLGIEAEPIGPQAIAVHAFTSFLFERGVDPVTFMTELLDKAVSGRFNDDPEAALHETLDMMACKAAVKAGDRLSPVELAELLNYRETIERASNCPHGRPTTLRVSLKELDKQFGRT